MGLVHEIKNAKKSRDTVTLRAIKITVFRLRPGKEYYTLVCQILSSFFLLIEQIGNEFFQSVLLQRKSIFLFCAQHSILCYTTQCCSSNSGSLYPVC